MNGRGAALTLALVLWALLAPAGAHAQVQSVHGTLRAPAGTPVAGVTITATRNGAEAGKAITAKDGTWEIPVPGPGRYTITLDVTTLPTGLSPAREGGQTLRDVPVPAGESRAVIFQLTTGAPVPGTGPGQPGGGGGGPPQNTITRWLDQFAQLLVELSFSDRSLWIMAIAWLLVALACGLMFLLIKSPWGRVIRSVRENEDAARSLGKNVFGYRLQSLVLGGVLGAIGGMLLAVYTQAVQPDAYNPVVTFYLYTLLILGGAGRILGPVVGSVIFWFVLVFTDSFLRQAIGTGLISASLINPTEVGAIRFALVGAGLMLLMVYRPQGILGDRREMLLGDS